MKQKRKLWTVLMMMLGLLLFCQMTAPAEAKKKAVKILSLSKAKVTLSKKSYTYNGKAKKPSVTVKVKKKKLKKNRDYTLRYKKNKSAGTAQVVVKAKNKNKYKGKKKVKYKINKAKRKVVLTKTEYTAIMGDGDFSVAVGKPSKGAGTVKYSCVSGSAVTVTKKGKVTVKEVGTATIRAAVAEGANYKAAYADLTVTVYKKPTRQVNSAESIRSFIYPDGTGKYACTYKYLTDFEWNVVDKYCMTGMAPTVDADLEQGAIQCNNLCPQGICIAGDYLLTTAYCMDDTHGSCVFIYDKESGALLRTLILEKKSHVGGITFDGNNVWICHAKGKELQRIAYDKLKAYVQNEAWAPGKYAEYVTDDVELPKGGLHAVANKPSAISYNPNDGYLWVTTFAEKEEEGKCVMAAYEYKDGELKAVSTYLNTKEQDFLGVTTQSGAMTVKTVTGSAVSGAAVSRAAVSEVAAGKETTGGDAATGAAVSGSAAAQSIVVSGAAVTEVHKKLSGLETEYEFTNLEKGDLIVRIGDTRIVSSEDLSAYLDAHKAGDQVEITALRTVKADTEEEESAEAVTGSATEGRENASKDSETIVISGTLQLDNRETKTVFRTIPTYVQGLTFTKSGKVIFSRSYGRNTNKAKFISELMIYDADWDSPVDYKWQELMAVGLPPMVEEVEMNGDEVYMLFESAATTYLEGTDGSGQSECPIDKIISVKLNLD